LVFATSVQSEREVLLLTPALNKIVGCGNWNFALDDCDRILRVVSPTVSPEQTVRILLEQGYTCKESE
jgi:hypothetical protein